MSSNSFSTLNYGMFMAFLKYIRVKRNQSSAKQTRVLVYLQSLGHHAKLINLLDIALRHYFEHTKSFLRDTVYLKNHLLVKVPDNAILVSCDIELLYSNISEALWMEAIMYWLHKYPDNLRNRYTKYFFLDVSKLILKNNST